VDADVLSNLSANDIMLAVQQLPPSYRIVFVLHVVEGFKHEEIAEQLGITVGSTKSNLFKAKAQLREMLNQWNHAD
jgi:RNA polymerase sigma factor (sigma-70 family)